MPVLSNLDDLFEADAVARSQVPCLHLVFGRQSTTEDGESMRLSRARRTVCVFVARPSILLISSSGLLPGAVLNYQDAERVGFGFHRSRVLSRKESVPCFPRRGMQYAFIALVPGSRPQGFPRQRMPLHTFGTKPLGTSTAFSVYSSPMGMYCGSSNSEYANN